jgi:hypothetical protein
MDRNSTEIPVLLPLFCVEICKGIPVPVEKKNRGSRNSTSPAPSTYASVKNISV